MYDLNTCCTAGLFIGSSNVAYKLFTSEARVEQFLVLYNKNRSKTFEATKQSETVFQKYKAVFTYFIFPLFPLS